MQICTEKDDFVTLYQELNPTWTVWLNSGLVVFQDDGRPGIEPRSAWERLYHYCHENNDYIKRMNIKFRSNIHPLPNDADGYYFAKGVRGGLAMVKPMQLFFVGTFKNGILNVTCYKVPEMLKEKTKERDINKVGLCLIKRNTNLY